MAKNTFIVSLCLCTAVAIVAAGWSFSRSKTTPIEITQVDSIIVAPGFKLSDEKVNQFVADWNKAKSNGPTKYIPLYMVTVYLKGGMHRMFLGNGGLIKEKTDEAFRIGEKDYFEKLTANPK